MTPVRLAVRAEPVHPVRHVLADLGELFTVVDGDGCDAAFVAHGCVGELLGRGVHVLAQPPLGGRSVAAALRTARKGGSHFRVLDLAEVVDPLVALARERLGPAGVAEVEVLTTAAGLETALRVLHGVLPSLRPWRILAHTPELATGVVGDSVLTVVVRATDGPAELAPDRILVRGAGGTAITSRDGLHWHPGPFGGRPEVHGAPTDPHRLLRARLTDFHAVVTGRRTPDPREAQLAITVSRLAEELSETLTGAAPPAAFPPETAGEAHRAGLAQAGDPEPAVAAAQRLERIALHAMAGVLADACRDGRERTAAEILSAARVAPGTEWLVRRWIAVLVEEGVFEVAGDRIRPVPRPHPPAEDADIVRAYAELGFPPPVGEFHTRVRAALPELVRGEVALSALLFPQGGTGVAEALYAEGWASRYLNAATARAVRAALAGRTGPATVLELGAGVGATTRAILTELASVGDVTDVRHIYSDLSRLFLVTAARREWGRHRIRPAMLDINADLVAQGAPARSADVVVAGHVLHSAADLGRTLRGVRATLREGGLLAVVDATAENYALLASIQLLRSADEAAPSPGSADGRAATGRMFPTADEWRTELVAAGFTVHACLPGPDHAGAALGQALFLAEAR